MTQLDRLSLASRAFTLAAILGLSLALLDSQALRGTVLLTAIAAVGLAAEVSYRSARPLVAVPEGALAALVVGVALPDGILLLPYLVVPSLLVGLSTGLRAVIAVVAVESLAITLVIFLTASSSISTTQLVSSLFPWLVASLGVGFLCVWLRELGLVGTRQEDIPYESARRLLTQLRTVSRRLADGLDTVTLSSQMLATVHQHLDDFQSAVFVRTEGGVLTPVGYRGHNARQVLMPHDEDVNKCWRTGEAVQSRQPTGLSARRNRVTLPVRSDGRMLGVVLAETPSAIPTRTLDALFPELERQSLRLETALTFDEVRSIATLEERRRVAREIHDGIAQEIASLGYAVDELCANSVDARQRQRLTSLRGELSRIVSELRLSIFDLKSEVSGGLGSALSDYVREVGARSGLTVHLTLDQAPTRLRHEVEIELLRIAQEAVTNARKHSAATNLWVDCRIWPPYARIQIADDGRGLGRSRNDSYGIGIMKERAARISAQLEISASDTASPLPGTKVVVTMGTDAPVPAGRARGRETA